MTNSNQPPPSNTGATHTLKTSDRIDWLSLTFPSRSDVAYPEWWRSEHVETKPFNGYQKAFKYADGRVELFSPDRPDMGVHVVLSGDVIDNLAGLGVTELTLFSEAKAVFRRFDVARDLFDSAVTFRALERAIRTGKAVTSARKFPTFTENGQEGKTQYIGRKSSDRYARIYDKAYEQNLEGLNWLRVEAIYRDDFAPIAVKAFITGTTVVSLIRSVIDFPSLTSWVDAFSCDNKADLHCFRKQGNTERWLLEACAPALAKLLYLESEPAFAARFWQRVEYELERVNRQMSST